MSAIVTKEDIKQEIEKVPDEKLETLYKYVKYLTEIKPKSNQKKVLWQKCEKLKSTRRPIFRATLIYI